MKRCHFFAILIIVITQVACSKSSNNPQTTIALSLPQQIIAISALPANTSTQAGSSQFSNLIHPFAYNDPGTDYSEDETVSYLFDSDIQYINTINYLLCVLDQFGYQSQVNKGPYKAVIDYAGCVDRIYPRAIITDTIIKATVVSTRANNNSPHVVKIWLQDSGSGDTSNQNDLVENQTLIEIIINRAPTDQAPFGDFMMVFSDIEDASGYGGNTGEEFSTDHGTYRSHVNGQGDSVFQSIYTPIVPNVLSKYTAFNLLLYDPANFSDISNTSDSGAIRSEYHQDESTIRSAVMQYDQTRVLKGGYNPNSQTIEDTTCLARDEPQANILGYTLYHRDDAMFRNTEVTAGQRVINTAGFSFLYNGLWGWISQRSYSLENDSNLPDGAVITRRLDDGSEQQFTVHLKTGKLQHSYNIELPLSDLRNSDLIYRGAHPVSGVVESWVLRLDDNNDFNVVKKRYWNGVAFIESDNYDDDADPNTPNVPVAATIALQNGQSLYLSSKALDFYRYRHDTSVAAGNRSIVLSGQSDVDINYEPLFPTGVPEVTVYCYYKCLRGGLTQADVETAANYTELYHNHNFNSVPRTYTVTRDTYKVSLYDGLELVDASQLDLSKFDLATLDLSYLLTEPLPGSVTFSQLLDSTSSYSFSTGHFVDGDFILVDEAENLFSFDEAMRIEYQYLASHDLYNTDPLTNPYHELIFTLLYVSAGSLAGLPYTWDESGMKLEVNLQAGTQMSNTDGNYIVKGTWEYQRMVEKDISECNSLNLTNLLDVPDLVLLTDGDIPTITFTAADKPLVQGEPAVKP